jgi:hypothetical protein
VLHMAAKTGEVGKEVKAGFSLSIAVTKFFRNSLSADNLC